MKGFVIYASAAIAALGAAGFVGSRLTGGEAKAGGHEERFQPPVVAPRVEDPNARELLSQVKALRQEVARLRGAVEAAPHATESRIALAEAEDPADDERSRADTQRSAEASERQLVPHYTTRLESEVRDVSARDFERTIRDEVALTEHTSVQSVDCRSTLCRLVLRHDTPIARMRLARLAAGSSLSYGWHYYPSDEDELETIAFIGMPDHPLQPPAFEAHGDEGDPTEGE